MSKVRFCVSPFYTLPFEKFKNFGVFYPSLYRILLNILRNRANIFPIDFIYSTNATQFHRERIFEYILSGDFCRVI